MSRTDRNAIIVVGMHQSGAYALTRLLKEMGVDLGSESIPSTPDNDIGNEEHAAIRDTHERLLRCLSSSWDDVLPLPALWWDSPDIAPYKSELVNIVRSDFSDSLLWGFQDPRACRLLPLWHIILEETQTRGSFLIPFRDPLDVASSLSIRSGFAVGKSCLLWLRHMLDAEKATRGNPRLFVDYEGISKDWRGLVSKMEATLQVRFPIPLDDVSEDLELLLQSHMHQRNGHDSIQRTDETLSKWIGSTYAAAKAAATHGEDSLIAQMSSVEEELKEAEKSYMSVISDVVRENQTLRTAVRQRDDLLAQSELDLEIARQALSEHAFRIAKLRSNLDAIAEVSKTTASASPPIRSQRPWVFYIATFVNRKLRDVLRSPAYGLIVRTSGLFDSNFYRNRNPDLRIGRIFPLFHYMRKGYRERRDPNPLFSSSYYLRLYPDVATKGVNPLAHYIQRGASEGRNPGPLFDTTYYLGRYNDVSLSGMNPLAHYLAYGMSQGRSGRPLSEMLELIRPHISNKTQSSCMDYLHPTNSLRGTSFKHLRIGVYTHSEGNYFFNEIRDIIIAGIRKCGSQAVALDEKQPPSINLTHRFVIAPHEFFYLGSERTLRDDPAFRSAVLITTEQLQTKWFIRSLPFLFHAQSVLDINFQVAAALRDIGVNAHFLPLGFVEDVEWLAKSVPLPQMQGLESLPGNVRDFRARLDSRFTDRPIDISFVGTQGARREQFFTTNASLFDRYKCFFHLVDPQSPTISGKETTLTSQGVAGLSQRSKIVLNIHRDELRYFEWHRIVMQAILHKTLVVTEPTFYVPHLEPGLHFVECPAESMPGKIRWLLDTQEGRREAEKIRQTAYDTVRARYDAANVMKDVLNKLLP